MKVVQLMEDFVTLKLIHLLVLLLVNVIVRKMLKVEDATNVKLDLKISRKTIHLDAKVRID